MSNYCNYEMKIKGKKENVKKLVEYLQAKYYYEKNDLISCSADKHFFRVFEAEVIDKTYDEEEIGYGYEIVSGNCAWSVCSCMFSGDSTYYSRFVKDGKKPANFKGTNMVEVTKELDLDVEIFSEETGVGFMEHFLVSNGIISIEKCVDYTEGYDEETDEYNPVGGFEWEYTI